MFRQNMHNKSKQIYQYIDIELYLGSDYDAEHMRQSFENKRQAVGGYYNTITNPVPNYNQNPYIAKERTRAAL